MDLSYSYRPKNSVKFAQSAPTTTRTRRRRTSRIDDIELTGTRTRSAGILKKNKKKKVELKKIASPKNLTWKQKLFWAFIAMTVLRLFFMERGIWDFYQNKLSIEGINQEITLLKRENSSLRGEIKKVRYDRHYQKQMARQHLGVIARDEYLILFAKERAEKSI